MLKLVGQRMGQRFAANPQNGIGTYTTHLKQSVAVPASFSSRLLDTYIQVSAGRWQALDVVRRLVNLSLKAAFFN